MDAFQGAALGILQGVTEWLPVSSEGQTMLVMIGWLGASPSDALSCSLFLHLGTMIAVILRFRWRILLMARDLGSGMTRTVVVSTLFTGVTGVPLYLIFRESFTGGRQATLLIGLLLMVTGLMLRLRRSGFKGAEEMTFQDMAVLGLAQGLSILPGVSRSGTTLTVLLMQGMRQEDALTISFLISVPAILGAIVLDGSIGGVPPDSALAMLLTSFVAGYLTMDLLIRFARDVSFSWFCVVLGMITVLSAAVV
ncbi:MAG: undecaprenyl-diphosphate phosphatase [Methanothrix sp.]|nr:undecaprenyl-diphosphate phosphatase [Methanothrix sp.]